MYKEVNHLIYYCTILSILTGGMLLYFRIAERRGIIDRPNERSSHRIPTVRGGGVVFILALVIWFVSDGFIYPWFVVSAVLIATVSFADDIRPRPALLRTTGQFIAFALMGIQAGLFDQLVWLVAATLVIGIGAVNAFNFMDGINGITGAYSLVNLATLYYINTYVVSFTEKSLITCIILSVLIFVFFNFRRRARCFAGDVGSVTIAFIQIFLILQLIYATGSYGWSLLFLLYGIDSIVTILYRLKRKENIFKAHRSHLYQYFSNELGVPHLQVSLCYGLIQLASNVLLITVLIRMNVGYIIVFIVCSGLLYVAIREKVLKRIGVKGFFVRTEDVSAYDK